VVKLNPMRAFCPSHSPPGSDIQVMLAGNGAFATH
jgi:hypothetical protein